MLNHRLKYAGSCQWLVSVRVWHAEAAAKQVWIDPSRQRVIVGRHAMQNGGRYPRKCTRRAKAELQDEGPGLPNTRIPSWDGPSLDVIIPIEAPLPLSPQMVIGNGISQRF
jgi:hypothetical protein